MKKKDIKQLLIPCNFGDQTATVPVYVKQPKTDKHPIQFQANWLMTYRGGSVPQPIMDALEKLHNISKEHNIPLVDLCSYTIKSS